MDKLFTYSIKTENITFRHARGPSIEQGKEFHTYHEIILFLEGDARLITEELNISLKPDSLIIIPKESYHQLIILGDKENYCRFVVNFEDAPELYDLIQSSMKEIIITKVGRNVRYIMENLSQRSEHPQADKILKASLVLLLSEIEAAQNSLLDGGSQHPVIRQATEYIGHSLDKRLTIEDIARHCHISPSSLSHIFRKEMNIPLHKFIIKKRLIAAFRRINEGEAATTAALSLGFNDYSGFYRQYVKMFGHPPSKK